MGCHIAVAQAPFCSGIRKYEAIFSGRILCCFLAPFTRLNDDVAGPAVKTAARFGHKGTFQSLFTLVQTILITSFLKCNSHYFL